ncbi:MAG: 4Fe-4S dicluster domain-containing protein [Candidatus Omnitrophica bacterium]|nr:4Fe-4S dicluster domain-containing protein [Candidatus Omnitrophota bacterium]
MKNNLYTIGKKDLFDLFSRLSVGSRVVVPYISGENFYFADFDSNKEDNIELGGIRQSEPVKSFFSHAREKVAGGDKGKPKPLILAGVKSCDLAGFYIQDSVFLGVESEDPIYTANRKNTTIISVDCTFAKETCFCIAIEGTSYPTANFDMNLSIMDNNILVEVATAKGAAIVSGYRMFFKDASTRHTEIRDSNRKAVSAEVKDFIDKRGTPDASKIKGMIKDKYNLQELWQDAASTCVECGACNLICPTCHCFLLFDESRGAHPIRNRVWDSCLYKSFARVAGGANPRKHLYERMRNRFDKKFSFFPETIGRIACTGCGRCIDACAGNIDIREVLKGLVNGKWNKPPHK